MRLGSRPAQRHVHLPRIGGHLSLAPWKQTKQDKEGLRVRAALSRERAVREAGG